MDVTHTPGGFGITWSDDESEMTVTHVWRQDQRASIMAVAVSVDGTCDILIDPTLVTDVRATVRRALELWDRIDADEIEAAIDQANALVPLD